MTEPRWLNADERRAWLANLSINTLLPAALDTQLHGAGKLSLFDYNVMAMLSEAEGHFLPDERAGRPDQRLAVPALPRGDQAAEPRLAGAPPASGDARVTTAHLTDDGMATFVELARAMWKPSAHCSWTP